MKKILLIVYLIIVCIFFVACNQFGKTDNVTVTIGESDKFSEEEISEAIDSSGNSSLSVWSKEYVLTYNNHNYVVTDQSTNEVKQVIGTVTYHGNKPGCFRLFSIKQEEGLQKIAIETRSGYLIAIREQ